MKRTFFSPKEQKAPKIHRGAEPHSTFLLRRLTAHPTSPSPKTASQPQTLAKPLPHLLGGCFGGLPDHTILIQFMLITCKRSKSLKAHQHSPEMCQTLLASLVTLEPGEAEAGMTPGRTLLGRLGSPTRQLWQTQSKSSKSLLSMLKSSSPADIFTQCGSGGKPRGCCTNQ